MAAARVGGRELPRGHNRQYYCASNTQHNNIVTASQYDSCTTVRSNNISRHSINNYINNNNNLSNNKLINRRNNIWQDSYCHNKNKEMVSASGRCRSVSSYSRLQSSTPSSTPFNSLMHLLLLLLMSLPTRTLAIVTVPPFMMRGPPSGELLYTVTHDPLMEPDPVTLHCDAEATPPPQYSWLKDGEEWDPSAEEDVTTTEGKGTITFVDPRPEDEGVYQCVASNSAGKLYFDKTWMHRSLLGHFPSIDPKVITVDLGDPLTIECSPPQGNPQPSTTWLLQTSEGGLKHLDNSRITVDDEGTLRFAYVRRSDETKDALYACAASSATSLRELFVVQDAEGDLTLTEDDPNDDPRQDFGIVTSVIKIPTEYRMGNWVYLNVSAPGVEDSDVDDEDIIKESPPKREYISEEDIMALVGQDLQVFCIYSGFPTPAVQWTKQTSDGTVELATNKSVLHIGEVALTDAATYRCHPSNRAGEGDIHTFNIEVQSAPSVAEFMKSVSLPQGELANFSCEVTGVPEPTIEWTRDGLPIEESGDVRITDTDDGQEVAFLNLMPKDKSVIACNISNVHGYVYQTAFLNVLSMPPEFEVEPEDTLALEGDSAIILCGAHGSPDPDVLWFRVNDEDNQSAENDTDIYGEQIEADNELYEIKDEELLIGSVNQDTVGRYRCLARNKFGEVERTVEIDSRTRTSLEFSSEAEAVRAGNATVLRCVVTHDPRLDVTVEWYKDDEQMDLEEDDRMVETVEDQEESGELTVVLRIRDSKGPDSGVYTCKASTSLDEVQENTIIFVEDVPSPPSMLSANCEGALAFLEWSSGRENSAPILSYTVQYATDLDTEDWQEATAELSSKQTDTEVTVRYGREYYFRVIAVNRVGQSEPGDVLNCTTRDSVPAHHPLNTSLSESSATTLYLEWEPVELMDQQGPGFFYEILWREDDGDEHSEWERKIINNWEESGARIPGLDPNTVYEVQIKAVNDEGPSGEEVPTMREKTAPAAPSAAPLLRVAEVKADSAVVMWPPLGNKHLRGELKGYQLNVFAKHEDADGDGDEDDAGSADDELDDIYLEGDVRRATLTGLSPYTEYYVRIRADNEAFQGVYSEPRFFWTREARSSPVSNLRARALSSTSLLVDWSPPAAPNGKLSSYYVTYSPLQEGEAVEYSGEGELPTEVELDDVMMEARTQGEFKPAESEVKFIIVAAPITQVKLADLEEDTEYKITVYPRNSLGDGQRSVVTAKTEDRIPSVPIIPVFTWTIDGDEDDIDGDGDADNDDHVTDKDGDNDIDEDDMRNANVFIGDTDNDGDVDKDDVLDTDGDGDIDQDDERLADIDKDGDIDEDDVRAADRNLDGVVDFSDIGDEDGDGDVDSNDLVIADEDGDGDIDASDDNEENTILEDRDGDGDIDANDVGDIDGDGDVDSADRAAADIDNDGDVDKDDVLIADRDGDGDVDGADVMDISGDGKIGVEDLEVTDRDGDGVIDRKDFELKDTFIVLEDGEVTVLDVDKDGDIDDDDRFVADINKDGIVDDKDIEAADRDGDGDVDVNDIGDEDNDGDVDAKDVIAADEDGDGDIDASDDNNEFVILRDRDGDGVISEADIQDVDGDGDADKEDLDVFDIDNDGDVDEKDLAVIDRDGDGDVDAADVVDFDGDGKIDEDDFEVTDKDGDGDVDGTDAALRGVFLADTNDDGVIDEKDVLDNDGDGTIDADDVAAADIDNDGDVDEDDVQIGDHDGDGDIDDDDVRDWDGDGVIEEEDVTVKDRNGNGVLDVFDFTDRNIILGDTNRDGNVDEEDVLDTDGDGDVDDEDIDVADINNDGKVDEDDVRAGDRDRDGLVDFADIGDIDGDGDVDGDDVVKADADGDGDIEADDNDGLFVLISDKNGDGKVEYGDLNGDGIVDNKDKQIADVNNDGKVDKKDIKAADQDGDGDVDGADLVEFNGDGKIDGRDLAAADRDGDGDIDRKDYRNRFTILGDTNDDGSIDEKDVLDTDGDGDVDQSDIDAVDIDNDGDVDIDDIHAADQDGDGDVDARDINDEDGDGDIDAHDINAADSDGDGDIDAADDGKGIDVTINLTPEDFEGNLGKEFYVQYRPVGTRVWRKTPEEDKTLHMTLQNLDPYKEYEVQVVAKDGEFEKASPITHLGPFKAMETDSDPTVLPSDEEKSPFDPLTMTWFVIALIVAITMMLVICFSIWTYNHRLSRIAALRAKRNAQYGAAEGGEKAAVAATAVDLEAAEGADEEQPMTAQTQRQQMAAMMRRQDTIQSVDSFASHDDDFAEYGDETMGTFNEEGSLIYQKI